MYPKKFYRIPFLFVLSLLSSQLIAQLPLINLVTPSSGPVGSQVTITGSNFNSNAGGNIVYFGAVKAVVSAATPTSIITTVPAGASYQFITVTANHLTGYSQLPFSVTYPGHKPLTSYSFTPPNYINAGGGLSKMAVADFDGDGKADVMMTYPFNSTMIILPNTGSKGNISFAPKIEFTNPAWQFGTTFAVGDLDGDGKPDLALANPWENRIYTYRNTSIAGSISFALPVEFSTGNSLNFAGVSIADVDVDGKPDIVTFTRTTFSVLKNISTTGNISFAPKINFTGGGYNYSMEIGDFNLDRKPDIAIVDFNTNKVSIYKNTCVNTVIAFDPAIDFSTGSTGNGPKYISMGDFDADGKPDIATTNYIDNSISLFNNNSSSRNISFYPKTDYTLSARPISIQVCNINGDGKPDIIVGFDGKFSLSVLQNTETGVGFSFAPSMDYPMGQVASNILAWDADNDGRDDISSTNSSSFSIAVLRNREYEPIVKGFSPVGGDKGTNLIITGLNFTGVTGVKIGDSSVNLFTILNDTSISSVVGNGATGYISVTSAYGTGSIPGFIFGPPPSISSFSPAQARSGTQILIKGRYLTNATAVSFGGTPAQNFYNISDSSIVALTGTGSTGNIRVTTATGTASIPGFTFLSPPEITSFSPDSSFSGATIIIKGKNFTGANSISFGGINVQSYLVLSDTVISVVVGLGATGIVSITTWRGTGLLGGFTYLGPNISSFTPVSGGAGTLVSLTGTNFTGATAISFGGTAASLFTVISDSVITATTGIGSTGDVSVTTPAGTGIRKGFTAPPRITAFAPAYGLVGTAVRIDGNSFAPHPLLNIVYFGTSKATVTAATSTSLTVNVPAGGAYMPINVTSNKLTGYSSMPYTTTFAGGPFIPAYFALGQPIPKANSITQKVALGDLNLDGKTDMVTVESGGAINILKNNSTAGKLSFDPPLLYDNNYLFDATGVALADIDADGFLDIVVIYYGYNMVSVYKNNTISYGGKIAFAARVNFTTGYNPSAVSIGDLDGDGRPDMVVTNYYGQSVSVFRNSGSPYGPISFAPKTDFPTGVNPVMAAVADIDKDGKADIAVANELSATISILKNTGSSGIISFSPKTDFATGTKPRSIRAGDLDGDSDVDLVVSNSGDSTISVFKNTSDTATISFTPAVNFATGSGPNNVIMNDLDGDGKPDLAVSHLPGASMGILKNTTTSGTFSFDVKVDYPNTNGSASGDIDGDGKPDIVSIHGSGISVVRNKFNEVPHIDSFSPLQAYPGDSLIITGTKFTGATAVEFGSSPCISFTVLTDTSIAAITGPGTGGDISVTTPYGTSVLAGFNFLAPPIITGFSPVKGPIGTKVTISGNNFNPVSLSNTVYFGAARALVTAAASNSLTVIVPPGATYDHISVTSNRRTGVSGQIFNSTFPGAGNLFSLNYFDTTAIIFLTIENIKGLAIADMDNDGKTDLAVSTSGNFSTFKNSSSGNVLLFGPEVDHTHDAPGHFFITDINGDGKPDIIAGKDSNMYAATVLKNTSTAGYIALTTDLTIIDQKPGPFKVYTGDFDGDGRKDLIVRSAYTNEIPVYRNTSSNGFISFAIPVVVGLVGAVANVSVGDVFVEDFNGDNSPDIAVVTNNTVSVFKNSSLAGSLAFSPKISIPFNGNAVSGVAADFDGDGKTDIAISNNQLNAVSLLKNNSAPGSISFEQAKNFNLGYMPEKLLAADLDGDGQPDICVTNSDKYFLSILKNTSMGGVVGFAARADYTVGLTGLISIADLNNDGKPEIITAKNGYQYISILRNTIGDPIPVMLCPPTATTTISSNLPGPNFQWQLDSGKGFNTITDNANFSNTNTGTLHLNTIPSSWSGYQFRCITGGTESTISSLKFYNSWVGSISNAWENPRNWGCASVPDANTDLIIKWGTIIINSNVTVKSLQLDPTVKVTLLSPFTLNVLH